MRRRQSGTMATVPTQMRLDAATEAGREADGLLASPAAEHCADAAGPEGRPRRPI